MTGTRHWIVLSCVSLACAAAGLLAVSAADPAVQADSGIDLLEIDADGVTLSMAAPAGTAGTAEVHLRDIDGKQLAAASRKHDGKPFKLVLSAKLDKAKNPENYYLRYRFDTDGPFLQRSLYFMSEILETTVLGQRELVAGTRPVIRVLVSDRAAGRPVRGAAVKLTLNEKDKVIASFSGKTNGRGELVAPINLPDRPIKGAKLTIDVASRTGKDTVTQTVNIVAATRTMLTTDKPLYQPGQVIHIRALSLKRPSMKALAGAPVTFEVEDAKGNKVFKEQATADKFGITHADFVLASELNKGTYRVRAVVAGAKEEKTVTVKRYVLPKFKVKFASDRTFYQPGDKVTVDLQVDYFFGKPVAGGKVEVACSTFDVAYKTFQTIEGKTDTEGHYKFDVTLPKHFVGQPLEAGKASAKFDVKVVDTADHVEKVTRNVSVTAAPIIVTAVPESGHLIGGLDNRIYIVTTYADSKPAECTVTVSHPVVPGPPIAIKTDAAGFGQAVFTPKRGQSIDYAMHAQDAKGNRGTATVKLTPRKHPGDDRVILRTDRSLYRVGQTLKFDVVATRATGSLYVDVIKDRQTYLTRTLDLVDGKASGQFVVGSGLAGTVQINAYLIGANGVTIRDRRLLIADPANDLKIAVTSDSETYLPGGEAKVAFKVTDKTGDGVASALGVMVVDEAVFALQEMQPGLEKIYFYLEKEIATPRYEVHGYEIDGCFPPPWPMPGPGPVPMPMPAVRRELDRRDKAARVLLASAKGVGDYSIHVNTFKAGNKTAAFTMAMIKALTKQQGAIAAALSKYSRAHRKDKNKRRTGIDLATLVKDGYLAKDQTLDPWGNPLKMKGSWCRGCQTYHGFYLASAGIDGKEGTADDVNTNRRLAWGRAKGGRFLGGAPGGMVMERMADAAVPMAAKMAAPPPAARPRPEANKRKNGGHGSPEGGGGGAAMPRIREYFPETLYFNPAVITDPAGLARLTIPLADSITTWRMTCMASGALGQMGSTTAGLRVFQDFFVDVDFPVALTQNDQISVPVVVYNYLKMDQKVTLTVKPARWFAFRGPPKQTLTLGPSEVRAVYFPITAKGIGFQKFTVIAMGVQKSDAVAQQVEVVPDGKETLVSRSGRLEGDIVQTIEIPPEALDDASTIFVKVYPGMLSQVVEGLDKMLRMPSGCFEQTSATTYPNILVMDYMKTTGKITPEIQMKAEGFINAGYQRLLSYEVKGGGFEWFGRAPAHRILTAFGLMEFHDMSKVHEVDPAVISRTQNWLARCQEKDGSYKPTKGGIAEGAINKYRDDVLRNTAYITWALASTGHRGGAVDKSTAYLRKHLDDIKDNFTLALTANAMSSVDPKGKTTVAVLQALFAKRTEEGELVHWKAASETPTHGKGKVANIEVTALAIQAFVRCGRELGTIGKAVSYLARNKDAYGTWQSTQATIQALRAMLLAERGATAMADATVQVLHNDNSVKTIKIDKTNSDVLQLIDLKGLTEKGPNAVSLRFKGKGALMYQVVGRYYMPHKDKPAVPAQPPMTITMDYDRTNLATEDIINVTATVMNNRPARAKMILVDLGLPPGFTLIPDKLATMIDNKTIEKYSTTGRQIIVYLRELEGGQEMQIKYQLMAKYPLRAKTAKAVVYEYYNPTIRAEAAPVRLTVAKAK